jgi:hypothetical protein
MHHRVGALNRSPHDLPVTYIATDQLDGGVEMVWAVCPGGGARAVNLVVEAVEHSNVIPVIQQLVGQMRTDKTRAARYENGSRHDATWKQ